MWIWSRALSWYLPVGVFGLQALSLDDVDPNQTLLDAVGGELPEAFVGGGSRGVIGQRVDLKHALGDGKSRDVNG